MNRSSIAISTIAAALLLHGCAGTPAAPADTAPTGLAREETSIPFPGHHSIRDWEADGQDGIWVQDTHRKWFYGRLVGPCLGLDFATRVAFVTRGSTLDRFSSLIVPDSQYTSCQLRSFTASEAPPTKKERKARATENAPVK